MTNLNVRGLNDEVVKHLKHKASSQNTSVNKLIISILEKESGVSQKRAATYHDLDYLAGTWTKADANEFKKATAYFNKIDKDMW